MKTEILHPVTDYIQESINFLTREEGLKCNRGRFSDSTV